MTSESITEQAARLIDEHSATTDDGETCVGDPSSHVSTCEADLRGTTLALHQAHALADAGLLAHQALARGDGGVCLRDVRGPDGQRLALYP